MAYNNWNQPQYPQYANVAIPTPSMASPSSSPSRFPAGYPRLCYPQDPNEPTTRSSYLSARANPPPSGDCPGGCTGNQTGKFELVMAWTVTVRMGYTRPVNSFEATLISCIVRHALISTQPLTDTLAMQPFHRF